jgi:hypothetical protein
MLQTKLKNEACFCCIETGEIKMLGNQKDISRASTLCYFILFFSTFEHVKSLLIMGPNNTKTHH